MPLTRPKVKPLEDCCTARQTHALGPSFASVLPCRPLQQQCDPGTLDCASCLSVKLALGCTLICALAIARCDKQALVTALCPIVRHRKARIGFLPLRR
jgi:hypothetical protein